jgi:hypothetical protein
MTIIVVEIGGGGLTSILFYLVLFGIFFIYGSVFGISGISLRGLYVEK